jgi:hypothetical protein
MNYSRPKKASAVTSGMVIITIPLLFIAFHFAVLEIVQLIVLFYVSRLAFLLMYETGYMENDIITVKKEKSPTIRLKPQDFTFFEKHYWPVVLSKVAFAALALLTLLAVQSWWNIELYVGQFLACIILMRLFFYAHNSFRGRMNILTEGGLIIMRYTSFLFLVIPFQEILIPFLLAFFTFPMVRILEYAHQEKFRFPALTQFVDDLNVFRVRYYGTLTAISAIIFWLFPNEITFVSCILAIYFLVYRFGCFAASYGKPNRKKVL